MTILLLALQVGTAAFSLWLLWVVRDHPAAFFMIGAAIFLALFCAG